MTDLAASRRAFLGGIGGLAAASFSSSAFAQAAGKPNSLIRGVQVGTITYSFRAMPDQSAAATLGYCVQSGISAIELMGEPAEAYAGAPVGPNMNRMFPLRVRSAPNAPNPLSEAERAELASLQAAQTAYTKQLSEWRLTASMAKFQALRKMYNDAGVSIYGFKPSAFETTSTDAEIDYGLRAAKLLGASHVTVELPNDPAQSLRLGKAAEKHGLKVGYHQHLQATPTLWDVALAQSPANGINLDLGHFVAAGDFDALAFIEKNHARITSMHLKDRKTKANGGANLPWGEGDTPLTAALKMIRDKRYAFPVTIEQEYPIPAGSDSVKEVARCLAYCRKALEA